MRQSRPDGRHKGPMRRVFAAFFDPSFDDGDLLRVQCAIRERGRHAPGFVRVRDPLVDFARFEFARRKRYTAATTVCGRALERIEPQASHSLLAILAMAGATIFG